MPFLNENVAAGLQANSRFQVGRNNVDDDSTVEQGIILTKPPSVVASYLYYECTVGVILDSGVVVHNRLPQYTSQYADTLAVIPLDDRRLDRLIGFGVNLTSKDQYLDIVQKMGHSRYWFNLSGQALRIGYQIPIPGLRSVGGVQVVPHDKNPQWAYNKIVPDGSYSGAILWKAEWSLWYTTLTQTKTDEIRVADAASHIAGSSISRPPNVMKSPYSQGDDNSY